MDPIHDPLELIWKTTPIRMNSTPAGYWAKGVLSIVLGMRSFYIPYGACADNPWLARQKALSEMAERIVWFITFIDLREKCGFSGLYSTSGWAAHVDMGKAQIISLSEYLERRYLDILINELSISTPNKCYSLLQAISIVAPPLYGQWDDTWKRIRFMLMIPLYFPQITVHIVYVVAVCRLDSETEEGVVFGIGHGSSFEDAFYSAKFELFLVLRALQRFKIRHETNPKSVNMAKTDLAYFNGLYSNRDLYNRVDQLFESAKAEMYDIERQNLSREIAFEQDYETIDFSWLQPKWLRPLSRKVCYTGQANGNILRRLKDCYRDFTTQGECLDNNTMMLRE